MMPRIKTLKKEIDKAKAYLTDPGKRKAAEEIIGVLELQLNDRVNAANQHSEPSGNLFPEGSSINKKGCFRLDKQCAS